ncbi:MAG: diguanylate cyclase [Parvibaculaceae bacterium]|nr:diguanylate cyclase [Parvibaculaceae bacterium]
MAMAAGNRAPERPKGRYWLVLQVRNDDPTLEYAVSLRENMISHLAVTVLDHEEILEMTETGIDAPPGQRWMPSLGVSLPVSLPRDHQVTLAVLVDNLPAPYDEVRQVSLLPYAQAIRATPLREMVLFGCIGIFSAILIGGVIAAMRDGGEYDEWLFVAFCFCMTLFWVLVYLVPQKFLGLQLPIYQPVYVALAGAVFSGAILVNRFMRRWTSLPRGTRSGRLRHALIWLTAAVALPLLPDVLRYPGLALLFILAFGSYVRSVYRVWQSGSRRTWPFMFAWALLGLATCVAGLQILGAPIDTVTAHFICLQLCTLSVVLIAYGAMVRLRESDLEGQIARRQAMTDALTGLGNRAAFGRLRERLEAMPHGHIIVGFIDVDGLKKINDLRGHERGDRLLICVADSLKRVFRKPENLFRVGGDEFIVVYECVPGQGVDEASEELAAKCQKAADATRANGFPDTDLSAGFCAVAQAGSITAALRQADALMYLGKRSKRSEA